MVWFWVVGLVWFGGFVLGGGVVCFCGGREGTGLGFLQVFWFWVVVF